MKHIVCLEHVPFEGPAYFQKAFEEAGLMLERRLVPRDGLPTAAPDALLVMGGPMSVSDQDPWLKAEADYIRDYVARGHPYLGVCLGSQLLALAIGGTVQPGPAPEAGLVPIRLTAAAKNDPLFAHFPDRTEVFAWHSEGITLPEGAVPLAGSLLFPVQAFRYGRCAYGLLFHLEVEAAGVDELCRHCPAFMERAGRSLAELEAETGPHLAGLNLLARRLIHRFVELIP